MKRKWFTTRQCCIIFVFVSGFSQLYAQENKLNLSITGGINSANIKYSILGLGIKGQSVVMPIAGLILEKPIPVKNSSIRTGLLYNGLGSKMVDPGSSISKSTLSYISVPLNFQYNLLNSKLGLYAGPQISLLLSAQSKVTEAGSPTFSESIKDQIKPIDVSALFGLQYKLIEKLSLSLSYQLGLSNIQNTQSLDSGDFDFSFLGKAKVSAFSVRASYHLK